jgi:cell division protein FtsB
MAQLSENEEHLSIWQTQYEEEKKNSEALNSTIATLTSSLNKAQSDAKSKQQQIQTREVLYPNSY